MGLTGRGMIGVVACAAVVAGCGKKDGETRTADSAAPATAQANAPARTEPATPDSQMQAVLDQLAKLGGKPIETLTAEEARKQPTPADAVKALLTAQGKSTAPEAVAKVANRTIPGAAGQLPARIYTPQGAGPFPVIVYYHGGGWVIADLDTYESSPRALANAAGAVVVSVHYRQAPEHKFPAAHDDAYAAYEWVVKNAKSINGDSARVAVAGESAGGNLAASVAMMARDKGGKLPVHQLLVYPIANYAFDSPSYDENASAKPLDKPMMQWFFRQYLTSEADGADPRISLVRAPDLKGLPPATVILAQIDPLRSEGEQYAEKLRAAGVDVTLERYDGVTHEFFGMGAVEPKAKDAVRVAADRLRKAFGAGQVAAR